MPRQLIKSTSLDDIADAIREKLIEEDKYYPKDMPDKIRSIAQEVGITDISALIAAVNKAFENSGMVHDGTYTYEQCVDYITRMYYKGDRLNAEVIFYDFDGSIILRTTLAEIRMWEEEDMPIPPMHAGLIFQCWNYTLEELQDAEMPVDVGANYITDDGDTRIVLEVVHDDWLTPHINIAPSVSKALTIDWGDGETTLVTGGWFEHRYANKGMYTICIKHNEGIDCTYTWGFSGWNTVEHIYLGKDCSLSRGSFSGLFRLKTVSIPRDIIGSSSWDVNFANAHNLAALIIPRGTTDVSFGANTFATFILSLPTTLWSHSNSYNNNIYGKFSRLCIPENVTGLGCIATEKLYLRMTEVPLRYLEGAWSGCGTIYVPPELYEEYRAKIGDKVQMYGGFIE